MKDPLCNGTTRMFMLHESGNISFTGGFIPLSGVLSISSMSMLINQNHADEIQVHIS